MGKYKEIRKLLSSLDNYERNYISLQLSVAESARQYLLETGIPHEEFAVRMKIKPTKVESFLNGSFSYSIKKTSTLKGLWYEFHSNNVENVVEENHTTVKIATNIKEKPITNFFIDEEKSLESVVTGEYIIYSKEIIDLDKCCKFKKAYEVIDADHMIQDRRHLIIIDDLKEKLLVPLTSDHFKPAKILDEKSLANAETGDIIILRKESDFGVRKVTIGNPYKIERFAEKQFNSDFLDFLDDNGDLVRMSIKNDCFELVKDFNTTKSINLCMKGDKIIFNETGKFYPTKANEHKMYFTFKKEYDVLEVCSFTETSEKDYLTVFDDNGIITEIYLFSTAFTRK